MPSAKNSDHENISSNLWSYDSSPKMTAFLMKLVRLGRHFDATKKEHDAEDLTVNLSFRAKLLGRSARPVYERILKTGAPGDVHSSVHASVQAPRSNGTPGRKSALCIASRDHGCDRMCPRAICVHVTDAV